MTQEITVTPSRQLQPSSIELHDPMAGINLALERGATVDIIERMMGVRRELQAERAKGQFDQAMSDFQMRCPVIVKNKSVFNKDGRSVRYKYATLDSIVAQTKELLRELGFSYAIFADVDVSAKCVKAKCRVTHSGGHSTESEFAVPIDPDGFMNAQQKFGSAMTFAKRYAFTNVFGILTSDEDTDANTRKEKPSGPNPIAPEANDSALREAVKTLWNMLKPVRGAAMNWEVANEFMHANKILATEQQAPNLPIAEIQEAISKARISIQERMGS